MAEPSRRQALRSRYVDSQNGWNYLFFSVAIACILGLTFRLYFSPERLKGWVVEALKDQKGEAAYAFDSVSFRLAKGAMPQFAIVVTNVRVAPAPSCRPEPSLTIAELTLPFRLRSIFSGRVAVGTVSAEGMIVDLDGLKVRCDAANSAASTAASSPSERPISPPAIKPSRLRRSKTIAPAASTAPPPEAKPWWQDEQLVAIRSKVVGVDFKQVEVQFENKSKRVYLDSFSASVDDADGTITLDTELRIPPEIAYGEKIPPLSIHARARSTRADVLIEANLSEGRLAGEMVLTPAPDNGLEADAHLRVDDVPLSTMVPLLTKSGITDSNFQPRFLWLDCDARIKGPFQGLFTVNPFRIEKCEVSGENAKMLVDAAVRQPDGTWDPFRVHLSKVDLGKLLRTLGIQGPERVASEYGRLSGELDLRTTEDAHFEGVLEGAKLLFSKRSVRVEQRINRVAMRFDLHDRRFKGAADGLVLDGGEFAGEVAFEFDRRLKDGWVRGRVLNLVFDPRVQNVLVGGVIGPVAGEGEVKIAGGAMRSLHASLSVGETEGREWRFDHAQLNAALVDNAIVVNIASPRIEVNRQSSIYRIATPLFFSHEFVGEWIPLSRITGQVHVQESGGARWTKARAELEEGQIGVSSEGSMNRERQLFGWVETDFPKAKNLRWALGGQSDAPVLTENSEALATLRKHVAIDDELLGLRRMKFEE